MRPARNTSTTLGTALALAAGLALSACNGSTSAQDEPSPSSPSASGPPSSENVNGALAPGRWRVPLFGRQPRQLPWAVVDVPPGYGTPGGWVVDRGADGDPEHYGAVAFFAVDEVVPDPCNGGATASVGPTVDDLVDALTATKKVGTTAPRRVRLDGRPAVYLEVTFPKDAAAYAGCSAGAYTLWYADDFPFRNDAAGLVCRLWILSVGGTRVVVTAWDTPAEDEKTVAEVVGIATSVHFVPPAQG